jgi:hypothetical protein
MAADVFSNLCAARSSNRFRLLQFPAQLANLDDCAELDFAESRFSCFVVSDVRVIEVSWLLGTSVPWVGS